MAWTKSAVTTDNRCWSGRSKYKRAQQCPI